MTPATDPAAELWEEFDPAPCSVCGRDACEDHLPPPGGGEAEGFESTRPRQPAGLVFRHPARQGRICEYVMRRPRDTYDGWFPRGRVSLIGGSSGTGKTSLMVALLDAQSRRGHYLGHAGAGLPYLIVFADRGTLSNQETLARLGLDMATVPIAHIPVCWGTDAVRRILDAVEAHHTTPSVVFVEGADTLVEDPNKPGHVAPFLEHLKQVAAHYHAAIVLSVGASKSRPKDEYRLKRDRIFGSQIWPRMAETVMVLASVGDGTSEKRTLDVLHRNAQSEAFELEFTNGRLVEAAPTTEGQVRDQMLTWMREVERFRLRDIKRAFPNVSGTRREKILNGFIEAGFVRKRTKDDVTIYTTAKKGVAA